ncbi:SAVED domain-containing protein [Rhodococcus erythropolis]
MIPLYTSEYLAAKKLRHERRVREVTDFATLRQTTVVRVVGAVRESTSGVAPGQLAEALLALNLTGFGEDTRTGDFFVQLTGDEGQQWFWDSGKAAIDKELTKVQDAITHGDTTHVSVFAIAPIPLLVYLGSQLDDKTETLLFERHRTSVDNPWVWPQHPDPAPDFDVIVRDEGARNASDVVVMVSVSADVSIDRIPASLRGLPLVEVRPSTAPPRSGLIDSLRALDAFAKAWRACLVQVERQWPSARTIHVIAAVPVTAAIQMGRDRMRTAQPDLVLYQRTDHATYTQVLEVTG